jgi:hypothetical protein
VERWRDLYMLFVTSGMVAERDLLEGSSQAARKRPSLLLDRPGMQECKVQYVLPPLAWVYLELGEEKIAQTLASETAAARLPIASASSWWMRCACRRWTRFRNAPVRCLTPTGK